MAIRCSHAWRTEAGELVSLRHLVPWVNPANLFLQIAQRMTVSQASPLAGSFNSRLAANLQNKLLYVVMTCPSDPAKQTTAAAGVQEPARRHCFSFTAWTQLSAFASMRVQSRTD